MTSNFVNLSISLLASSSQIVITTNIINTVHVNIASTVLSYISVNITRHRCNMCPEDHLYPIHYLRRRLFTASGLTWQHGLRRGPASSRGLQPPRLTKRTSKASPCWGDKRAWPLCILELGSIIVFSSCSRNRIPFKGSTTGLWWALPHSSRHGLYSNGNDPSDRPKELRVVGAWIVRLQSLGYCYSILIVRKPKA